MPLRANTVTGTKKSSQCFASTEEARRAQLNQDGRYIMRTVSESWSRRSRYAQDGKRSNGRFV